MHAQLLRMVAESLSVLATGVSSKLDNTCTSAATSTAAPVQVRDDEFVNFLEIQARTQVRILEVEVRAGHELIRLHKSQFERERVEVRPMSCRGESGWMH